jgi:hypothetical protein
VEEFIMTDAENQPALERFNAMLQEVAQSTLAQVKKHFSKERWKLAFLDVRAAAQGGSWVDKLRVVLPDGTIRGIRGPKGQGSLFINIWALRGQLFANPWYGFNLTVFPDGKCKTEFNYDPDCVNDPDFYDVDEELKKKALGGGSNRRERA